MSSFLSTSTISSLTGLFDRHFEQFSSAIGNYITVYKEPIKIINNSTSVNMYGYENDSLNNTDFTYVPVSQAFPAMIIYASNLKEQQFPQLRTSLDINEVMIKVKEDAKSYIMNGKTENVIINSIPHNIESTPKIQNYFGALYYYFKCTVTA